MLTSQGSNNSIGDDTSQQPPAPGRLRCPECQQTFSRVEHLTRHTRGHRKEHFLKCSFCRKSFYRSDALRRHEQVHKEPTRSLLGKGARACLACAAARRRCTGCTPCTACEKRSADCVYPDVSKSVRASASADRAGSVSVTTPFQHGPVMSDGEQAMVSPTAWSNMSTSPSGMEHFDRVFSGDGQGSNAGHHETRYRQFSSDASYAEESSNTQPTLTPTGASGTLPEPAFWSQSSINWLPDRWMPEFQVVDGTQMQVDSPTSPGQGVGPHKSMNLLADLAALVSHRSAQHDSPNQCSPPFEVGHDISSPGSHETQETGHFYVDGDGARLPRVRKAPHRPAYSPMSSSAHKMLPNQSSFAFPDMEYPSPDSTTSRQDFERIPQAIYDIILSYFNQTCVISSHFKPYISKVFPSVQLLSQFVSLYAEHFLPILPFTHPATFYVGRAHWLSILAMAAIGSHYAELEDVETYNVAMHELLRRCILTLEERNEPNTVTLLMTQAKLLNSIGMLYCGDERLIKLGSIFHTDLAAFCDSEWKSAHPISSYADSSNIDQVKENWRDWCLAESRRRTGYTIFLLDTMWSFHFEICPLLSLEDHGSIPLPCQEVLWEAESPLDWQQLYSCSIPSPSLSQAIQLAYVEKRLQSSMGEFSRILCIHAIFRHTWQVESYFSKPLSLWNPTAERQDFKSIQAFVPVWLPGVPIYSKWRNSACDCLDILHWHANSVIGAASGMEHTTVLHLHLARVILLTPFRQIVRLAQLLTQEKATPQSDAEIVTSQNLIRHWATEDQHKARLAMIHAGVLFWHVRRYSTDAFYEPSSVFLATLALWAYGTFAEHTYPAPHKPTTGATTAAIPTTSTMADDDDDDEEDLESLFPNSIQLDRPADDELVQLFVKKGAGMKANITGVGNLCSKRGPGRVLSEGRNLLVGLGRWGWGRVGVRVLEVLLERGKESRGKEKG